MIIPNIWENAKNGNQTTNQIKMDDLGVPQITGNHQMENKHGIQFLWSYNAKRWPILRDLDPLGLCASTPNDDWPRPQMCQVTMLQRLSRTEKNICDSKTENEEFTFG